MRIHFTQRARLIVLLAPLGVCVPSSGATLPELCSHIKQFAAQVPIGVVRTVSIAVQHTDSVAPSKRCTAVPADDQGMAFCRYLSERTSGEMLGGNISRVHACLVGATYPTAKHIFTYAMSGSVSVTNPFELKNVAVQLDYSYRWRPAEPDYFLLTVSGLDDDL